MARNTKRVAVMVAALAALGYSSLGGIPAHADIGNNCLPAGMSQEDAKKYAPGTYGCSKQGSTPVKANPVPIQAGGIGAGTPHGPMEDSGDGQTTPIPPSAEKSKSERDAAKNTNGASASPEAPGSAVPSPVKAKPTSTHAVLDIGKTDTTVKAVLTQISNGTGYSFLSYDSATGIVDFDNDSYAHLEAPDRRTYMDKTLGYVKDSSVNTMAKNKLYNFIADQDTTTTQAIRNLKTNSQADLATAISYIEPFNNIFSTILGVIAIAVVVCLGFSMVIDTAYIAVPLFRMALEKDRGEGGGSEKRSRLVSTEAHKALEESERSSKYKSAMGIYIKHRVAMLTAVGIALMYCLTGQIFQLVEWLVMMVQGAF